MIVRIICKSENRQTYEEMLYKGGFETGDDGNLTLYENNYCYEYLIGRDNGEITPIDIEDVFYIESFGNQILLTTDGKKLRLKERLYELESRLPVEQFIRISQSVIVNRKAIKEIHPTLWMKFHLSIVDGSVLDVTRNYYYKFKDFIGI